MAITHAEHIQLWDRIEEYSFEEFSDSSKNFIPKLCKEQNWKKGKAKQAIEEYKRFVFLCLVMEGGASPSHVVDQVWHLHLTYTKEYWQIFCKTILQKELHHYPANGSSNDTSSLKTKYINTLHAYFSFFDELPSPDFWPNVELNNTVAKINQFPRFYWILIGAFAIGFPLYYGKFVAFQLAGSQFLIYYLLLSALASVLFLIHLLVRKKAFVRLIEDNLATRPSIYQISYHLFDQHQAIQTALLNLMENKLLVVTTHKDIETTGNEPLNPNHPDFLQNPFKHYPAKYAPETEVKYWEVVSDWFRKSDFGNVFLNNLLIAPNKTEFRLVVCFIGGIGVLRILQGWNNGKPVGYLALEIVIFAALTAWIKAVCQDEKAEIRTVLKRKFSYKGIHSTDYSQLFAFEGRSVLSKLASGYFIASVFPRFDRAGRLSSSCTSTDSGSSCSGSSCSSGCGGCGGD